MVSHRTRSITAILASLAVAATVVSCGDDDGDPPAADATTSATSPSDSAADSASDTTSEASSEAGAWTYVDGSGTEVTLDEVPTRIVAHGSAAAALIPLGIRPVGIYADTAIDEDLALKNLDLDGIEIVGEEWGVINVEAVAALEPDLIVAEWWPVEQAYSGLEEGTEATNAQMLEIAPIVGITQGPSIRTMIEDYEALATSLGADLDEPAVAADRQRFEDALAGFEAAIAAKPDLSALAISPTVELLYVAVPEYAAELSDFVTWGLDLVVPDSPDEGFEYWETLSWENADKYQADLVIIDERSYPANLEQAEQQPTWPAIEAAATGAIAVWPAYWLRNYADYAAALERLTTAIADADEHLVD
ncbi:MAG TPA: ABC transporter substrate-binding protein [Ilumatobacteraceae bacterium]|nr:ABC transporter substrate-binding protein [Ilumatobacteraceae bacterium]